MVVLKGNGVNFLGREWLIQIQLDWNNVMKCSSIISEVNKLLESNVITPKLEALKSKYSVLFSSKLGKVEGFQAKLNVKPNAIPKFMKARPIPFALKEPVTEEIERLEREGILKPIYFSHWASPIVIATSPDWRIRMCGDFKSTINPILENEEYPMPTAEELFNAMQGGKRFSKIDLSRAYLQVELDEESEKYCVINTCK